MMNAESAKTIADFLIADYQNEIQTTERVLGSVPAQQLDYRPDGKSKTGLGLVRHLALEDAWLLSCIASGVITPPPDDSDACGILKPADAVDRYQKGMAAELDRLRALTGEQWAEAVNLFGMAPRVVFLSIAIKHSVHHRGQLSTYLRAMGGAVPGIYGPSADTAAAAT
jgi:uncharacterized damage-inducible protein DinB